MTSYYLSEALVIGREEKGESDMKIVFYTREYGRIEVIAKSIRLGKSKLKGHILLYSHCIMSFVSTRNGFRLIDSSVISAPLSASELSRLHYVHSLSKLILKVIRGEEKNEHIWHLLYNVYASRKLFPHDELESMSLKSEVLRISGLMPEGGIRNENDIYKVLSANHML